MRWIVVLALLMAPPLAEAGRHCRETSHVVGYQSCTRFGSWSGRTTLWYELGVVALRFDPKPIDATSTNTRDGAPTNYHVTGVPGDDRPITAFGARLRDGIVFAHKYFVVNEFTWASITGGPRLVADVATRGTTTTMGSSTGGIVAENKALFGVEGAVGPLTLSGALGPGVRIASYTTKELPDAVRPPAQGWFLVAGEARAVAWLTPNVTLGVEVGTNLLHVNDVEVGMTLGLHLTPFGHTR